MPRITPASEGRAARAATSPATTKSAWPMVMVVLAMMTDGRPSPSGAQGLTSQALTASPPIEAVGVVMLKARARRRRLFPDLEEGADGVDDVLELDGLLEVDVHPEVAGPLPRLGASGADDQHR